MTKEIKDQLFSLRTDAIAGIKRRENIVSKNPSRIQNVARRFFNNYFTLWQYEYLIEKENQKAKQYMYIAGKFADVEGRFVKEACTTEMYVGPYQKITTLLLSDSKELIERFINWEYDERYGTYPVVGFASIIQKILAGNKILAKQVLENFFKYESTYYLESRGHYGGRKLYEKDGQLMKALVEGNKQIIQSGIMYLVSEEVHKNRLHGDSYESNPNYLSFLSYPAVAILKTAWILGYEIEIDSPYIPMDLMPIQPLPKYEIPYFFLEGYEGKVPDNWIAWQTQEEKKEKVFLKQQTSSFTDSAFVWDKTKYKSKQEAIILENALQRGCRVEKDEQGDSHIYDSDGKKIGYWSIKKRSFTPIV